ncbi:MAG: MotA/TolQ/ExbB proton channel family protein [Gammaproteobacteria bacterium]|nr:MAG: MotA/TolQ/ExbB proton channel family protein [Gammaproteobacteria bacterium]
MNKSTIFGFLAGLILLIGMIILAPGSVGVFFSIPGLVVVIGGTLAATLISRPVSEVQALWRRIPQLFREEESTIDADIKQLLQFAERYRYSSPRSAERALSAISNPFLSIGLRQTVEGATLEDLTKSLQWRIAGVRSQENAQTQILYSMAAFAPAFGMLGTLFGLVHMLSGIGASGLNEIGGTMAFAMLTTVYGIVASNLVLKPLAIKLERRTSKHLMEMTTLLEGILQIHEKRHPTLIRETLESYYAHFQTQEPARGHLTLVSAA